MNLLFKMCVLYIYLVSHRRFQLAFYIHQNQLLTLPLCQLTYLSDDQQEWTIP